jgi:hypothetical protein
VEQLSRNIVPLARTRPKTAILSRQDGKAYELGWVPMTEEQSRVGEYTERAAMLRALAAETRYPEVRRRLLAMAAAFERLADQVEQWENARLAAVAD